MAKNTVYNGIISNPHIIAFALYSLGGALRDVHTENLSFSCFELAPLRFGWRLEEYKKLGWPSCFSIKNSIDDAKKDGLIVGTFKNGWRLTPKGTAWARDNQQIATQQLKIIKTPPTNNKEANTELLRIRSNNLFKKYKAKSLSVSDNISFTDMLMLQPDSPVNEIQSNLSRLLTFAELLSDSEVISFLKYCQNTFPHLLEE